MDYYVKCGGAAKADKIRVAFEKLGYDVETWRFTRGVYYTLNGRIVNTNIGSNEYELILNNPGYQELQLSVEPKFKVGDWLYHNTHGVRPILVKDYSETQGYKVECIRTTYYLQKGVVENEYHPWTIADAKDGDVLAFDWTQDDGASHWEKIVIFKKYHAKGVKGLINSPCVEGYGNTFKNGKLVLQEEVPYYSKTWTMTLQPATKEQRDLLFAKMREAGHEWDAEKKEVRKIKPHYDISNFYAGMPVLVRNHDESVWVYLQYSHCESKYSRCFNAGGQYWYQCIPFNGDTKHLLGTTDMCPEEFINWVI